MRKLTKDNLKKGSTPNKSGVYTIYNKNKKPIYIGHSKILRHRLQSYIQKDDFKEHRTKRSLRKESVYFSYKRVPVAKARVIEKRKKINYKYNKS